MANWSSDPDGAASALVQSALDELVLGDCVLLAATGAAVARRVAERRSAMLWNRRIAPSAVVAPDPPFGPFTSALLRLPKSRDEQIMAVHQCIGALAPTGRLYVYGGNSEGIRTFQKTLSALGPVAAIATRGHGRILEIQRIELADVGALKPTHRDWQRRLDDPPGWITYPGLFAAGAPDPGTALLLQHLPGIPPAASILDYGCGPGAIAAALRHRQPSARLMLLDNDSLALVAAAENVPAVTTVLASSLDAIVDTRFDLIVSNPPLHAGFKEDTAPLLALIAAAPTALAPDGVLLLVVQRRIALDHALADAFALVDIVTDDGRYRLWRATGRKATKPPPPVPKPRR